MSRANLSQSNPSGRSYSLRFLIISEKNCVSSGIANSEWEVKIARNSVVPDRAQPRKKGKTGSGSFRYGDFSTWSSGLTLLSSKKRKFYTRKAGDQLKS